MDEKVLFWLEAGQEDVSAEETAAAASDGYEVQEIQPMDPKRLPPLTEAAFVDPVTMVAVATIATLATRLVNHWLRGREQGVQIDLRKKTPVVSRLAGVPRGFLVVINKDGTVETHKAEYEEGADLVPLLQTLLAASKP